MKIVCKVVKVYKVHKVVITLCLFNFLFTFSISAQNNVISNADIFTNMYSAIKNVKTIRADIVSTERIIDHTTHTHYAVKINTSPYKSYSKDIDKGVEILYLDGKNNNEAIVNPNGFPYMNLHLDPMGKTMRNAQHQAINRLGFSYISNILYNS